MPKLPESACPKCGKFMPSGADYCANCGARWKKSPPTKRNGFAVGVLIFGAIIFGCCGSCTMMYTTPEGYAISILAFGLCALLVYFVIKLRDGGPK